MNASDWMLGDSRKGCLAVAQLWLHTYFSSTSVNVVWLSNEFNIKCFECLEIQISPLWD